MALIKKNEHGIADYIYVPVVYTAPDILNFKNETTGRNFCRISSVMVLCYTLITNATWGVFELLPYKAHLALDFTLGVTAFILSAQSLKKVTQSTRLWQ